MRRKIIFFVVLFGVLAWLFLFLNKQMNQTIARVSDKFILNHTDNVNRFVLIEDKDTLIIEKIDGNWLMDNYFPVNPISVKYFLNNCGRIRITSEFAENLDDPNLAAKEIHVFENNHLKKTYQIVRLDSISSIVKLKDTKHYYYANILGEEASLFDAFSTDRKFWRDKVFLKILPSQIKNIAVKYSELNYTSFNLDANYDEFELSGGGNIYNHEDLKKNNILQYLSYFSLLKFDEFMQENNKLDTQKLSKDHLVDIRIELQNKDVFQIGLYHIPIKENITDLTAKKYDVNYLYMHIKDRG